MPNVWGRACSRGSAAMRPIGLFTSTGQADVPPRTVLPACMRFLCTFEMLAMQSRCTLLPSAFAAVADAASLCACGMSFEPLQPKSSGWSSDRRHDARSQPHARSTMRELSKPGATCDHANYFGFPWAEQMVLSTQPGHVHTVSSRNAI